MGRPKRWTTPRTTRKAKTGQAPGPDELRSFQVWGSHAFLQWLVLPTVLVFVVRFLANRFGGE